VTKVSEGYVGVEIAEGTEITVQKSAVTTILPKGTIKSLWLSTSVRLPRRARLTARAGAAPDATLSRQPSVRPLMNRYPIWKYVVMVVALAIGFLYTLPNFFGEAPAVQVSSGKATVKLDSATLSQVEAALASAQIKPDDVTFENTATNANIRVRLKDTDTQLRVKDLLRSR
jgi:hypothetical protein